MIHLDTHVVVWLGIGEFERFPESLIRRMEDDDLAISPIVELELAFLHEIGRVSEGPTRFLDGLRRAIGLTVDATPFERVAAQAASDGLAFTRDPFDRIIAAQAVCAGAPLVTKDRALRQHLDLALWE